MRMTTLGTALVVAMLASGGAYAQQAPEPQDQMRAPGTGAANPPGQKSQAPANRGTTNTPTSSPAPVVQDQQKAPGTGTADVPGQKKKSQTTGSAPTPAQVTPPASGTGNMDRGSAPGTGTSTAPKR